MKITNQTESILTVKDGNIFGNALGGILFFAVGILIILSTSTSTNSLVVWLIGITFVLSGFAIIFLGYSISIDFDKVGGQIIYTKKRIIGNKSENYQIANVARIEVRRGYRTQSNNSSRNGFSTSRQIPTAQSFVVFKDGSELSIDNMGDSSVSIFSIGLNTNTESSQSMKIATFLGVLFQDGNTNNTGPGLNINLGPGGTIQL